MISLKSVVTACVIAVVLSCVQPVRSQELDSRPELRANLSECIRLALKNSHARKAHEYSIRAAEARLKQAQSGRYPALDFAAAYMVTDEDVNFIFPASTVQTSPIDLGMLSLPSLNVGIPQQDIKMADKRNALAELNLVWPLFTGGKVTALVKQARAGMALATCESRADDNRIVYETKKLYYSAVLASNLSKITRETRDRLLATLKVTERLYQEGSGKVTKSDYLKNKVYVEVAQSLLDQISGEGENASAALAEAMGLDWGMKIAVADEEIPFIVTEEPMDSLVNRLFRWNPQITRVEHALDLYRAKIAD
ncbi:MAG TPA: TolC family protein, partial [bacterium]